MPSMHLSFMAAISIRPLSECLSSMWRSDVQADAPKGGEAFRTIQGSGPHPFLVHDDVRNPVEAVLNRPVVADELQKPLRRNLRSS